MATETLKTFACDVCGKTFATQQALGGHKSAAHRNGSAAASPEPEPVDEDSPLFAVEAELRELMLPLREKAARLDREAVELQRQLTGIREARTRIDRTIRSLEPKQQEAKGAPDLSRADFDAKKKAVEAFLAKRPAVLEEGFTAASLQREMTDAGVKPMMSPEKVREILRQLHTTGVVRADKVVRGGGMLYLLIGSRNGAATEETT